MRMANCSASTRRPIAIEPTVSHDYTARRRRCPARRPAHGVKREVGEGGFCDHSWSRRSNSGHPWPHFSPEANTAPATVSKPSRINDATAAKASGRRSGRCDGSSQSSVAAHSIQHIACESGDRPTAWSFASSHPQERTCVASADQLQALRRATNGQWRLSPAHVQSSTTLDSAGVRLED